MTGRRLVMTLVEVAFQSLAYASVLYLISVGLSVTLGLMGFVNLAHGVFAMAGGYIAATAISVWGLPWPLVLLCAPLAVALLAAVAEKLLYARLYGRSELDQVLFCIGLIFIVGALARLFFGPLMRPVVIPAFLAQNLTVGPFSFYLYKLVVIGIGILTAAFILFVLERSRIGAIIRASVENRGMAESIGIRTKHVFMATFAFGGSLAALGGMLGADVFGLNPSYAFDILVYVQIVVAVAGLGTLRGSFVAALLVGTVQTVSAYYVPAFGTVMLFLLVFILLLVRPRGLFGRV
ncbi:branched-chain amino acid ABC transporter permease [Agrobacterium vitis]|uniref:Branched-chain amino acid ABC transporter permease n=2 Tax=Agrobacterium vitis TaxID=373 RepID=A0ABD6GEN7_AGRVI|nr:branched-chain amino acid ABC transporter permease [Agrobacterium vitis]MUO95052.1 branched-chain amino acid ABC transporter permease [Agrobacterium vitis]MUP05156.1 branched-chain amino acid ABC transporter permease [Agrobacterium vitis]MUZ81902.1 branched-chain amino acid ABC transporter permease [Agrobacterium vitis]MVA09634.1 branched-chain amino acid ABC transporter permease [Agrobacterium vitis]